MVPIKWSDWEDNEPQVTRWEAQLASAEAALDEAIDLCRRADSTYSNRCTRARKKGIPASQVERPAAPDHTLLYQCFLVYDDKQRGCQAFGHFPDDLCRDCLEVFKKIKARTEAAEERSCIRNAEAYYSHPANAVHAYWEIRGWIKAIQNQIKSQGEHHG